MLSKSKFCRGLQCKKSLWLYANKKEEQQISESAQQIFSRGTSVGELARGYFPNGVLAVKENEFPSYQTAKRTQELINQGVDTIYEATFIAEDTVVAIDILHKYKNGNWEIYEVKSTNSAKPEHEIDVAIQHYIATKAGLKIDNSFVLHFDNQYVRQGEIEVNKLFKPTNLSTKIIEYQQNTEKTLEEFHQLVKQEIEPTIEIGKHCKEPYHCDFWDYCHSENEVEETHTKIDNSAKIDIQLVKDFINSIEYPIAHFDFETIMAMGVPLWDNSRSYQQIPFQYSIHFQESENSIIIHKEYLAEIDISIDPRIGLITQMIEDLKDAKTIFAYNDKFETGVINKLIIDFPKYQTELESINSRIKDIAEPFKKHYYQFNVLGNLWSIKKVLPLICPELSYNDLEICDGCTASNTFYDLYFSELSTEEKQKIRENLREYCTMDTIAMVKIWEKLLNISNS